MHNHITTLVRFHCSEERLEEIKSEIWRSTKGDEFILFTDGHRFDFEVLIPMPEELKSTVSNGLSTIAMGKPDFFGRPLTENELRQVEKLKENIGEYGHPTWYSWAIANWGTEWNTYDCTFDGSLLKFETASRHPVPIMRALFEKYPDVRFEVQFADEDAGRNIGLYTSPNISAFPVSENFSPRNMGIAYKILGRDLVQEKADSEEYEREFMSESDFPIALKAYEEHQLP